MSIKQILALYNGNGGVYIPPPTPTLPTITNPLFIFSGESNSGGIANNTDASVLELSSRQQIQILNNNSLVFENLDIGTNNLIGHTGLEAYVATAHGWELGLCNEVAANKFNVSQVNLVKTGQGGSTIAEWGTSSTYWNTFKTRVDAALAINPSFTPILWYTQGINDAILGTSVSTWKAATIAHLLKIRARYGNDLPIIFPQFMPLYATYNTALNEIVASLGNIWTVQTSDLPLKDTNHWNYIGMKTMATRMVDKLLENYII